MASSALVNEPSPLVVDLEGTLLRCDFGLESAIGAVRRQPWRLAGVFGRAVRGKAALEPLVDTAHIDVSVLPYDAKTLAEITAARKAGRPVVLASANHPALAGRIATHLQLFDQMQHTNTGRNTPPQVRRASLGDWSKALRLHQWVKNALIFVPLLAAHQVTDPTQLWLGALAFLLFGLSASSAYLLNDLLDLQDDRHHASKRHRPLASGRLPVKSGLIAFPLLLLVAVAGALLLMPWQFSVALAVYYVLTLTYSLVLKKLIALDVITLALLYTIRVIAGGAAFGLPLTFWLLAFSMFMFLSLALCKRYAELRDALQNGRTEKARGRGYHPNDLEMISSLGAASGYQAVLVLALYIRDQSTVALYQQPHIIWLACPVLLFWVTRVWMLTHRGQMHDDPVVFAVNDHISLIAGVLFCLVFLAAA